MISTPCFFIQVFDGQGKNDTKSVKITVLQDPDILNVVEAVLNKNLSHFNQRQVMREIFKEKYSKVFTY